jgi:tRNA 5-methylaminomethyl-2-thiouridine biosynthesis bifunctional protein
VRFLDVSHSFVPIKTADLEWRDNLPYSIEYDDIYHSTTSGIEQCRHVFIDGNDLMLRFSQLSEDLSRPFTIAETGFGTGLSFLTTWSLWEKVAPKTAQLHFISCEKNPLNVNDLKRALANWPELAPFTHELISKYPLLTPGFHLLTFAEGQVQLTLMLGDAFSCFEQLLICKEAKLEAQLRGTCIDAWYLDGFTPGKNESMWSIELLQCIALLSKEGTTLATYTVASCVKAALIQVGFQLEKKEGFGPKRHMLTARFIQSLHGLKQKQTPWHVTTPVQYQDKKAVIIGAGLAGCYTAHALAARGWHVTLIEEHSESGKGASGNQQAVLFPKLSAYRSPLTQLMLQSFLYATTQYQAILKKYPIGELNGALLLAHDEKESKAQQTLSAWLLEYPELAVLVDTNTASLLAGLPVKSQGLFIPNSGWIDSKALCAWLINNERISLISNKTIDSLNFYHNAWQIGGLETQVLILANGYKLKQFEQTQTLPLKSIRGQMTSIKTTHESVALKIPLSGEGHVLPQMNGYHSLGATYDLGSEQLSMRPEDDSINLFKLRQLTNQVDWSDEVVNNWVGVRASTPDYLPLVGPVAQQEAFERIFSGLKSDSNRWIAQSGPYYPGLYVCAGFGSRGLTTIPLCAQWLAGLINNELSILPRNLIQALSPARFIRRNIIRNSQIN